MAAKRDGSVPDAQPTEQLALMIYTQLMGVTQSWLFAPRLFNLGKQRGFFTERLLVALQQP